MIRKGNRDFLEMRKQRDYHSLSTLDVLRAVVDAIISIFAVIEIIIVPMTFVPFARLSDPARLRYLSSVSCYVSSFHYDTLYTYSSCTNRIKCIVFIGICQLKHSVYFIMWCLLHYHLIIHPLTKVDHLVSKPFQNYKDYYLIILIFSFKQFLVLNVFINFC